MRQIGTLPEEQEAQTFADYLLTHDITTRVNHSQKGWDIWVHKEDQLARAREALDHYRNHPEDPRYERSSEQARVIRREAEKQDRLHARNTHDLRGRLGGGPASMFVRVGPMTRGLIIASVVVTLLQWQQVEFYGRTLEGWLGFTTWMRRGRIPISGGLDPILRGEVWRLITPIFLHFGGFHILFNMIMLYRLGPVIEARRGTWEFAALVLWTALVSNVAQYFFPSLFTIPGFRQPSGIFGGMSGVIFGLFGYVWALGRYRPEAGMYLPPATVRMLVFWLIFCAFISQIANTAHVAGLVAGILFAMVPIGRSRIER